MITIEQQAVMALNRIASQMASLQAGTVTSWWERWGSMLGVVVSVLVALAGWAFLVGENRRSNEHAFRLRLKDAARNRILDALYDYEDFLDDLESPARLFLQDASILKGAYSQRRGQFPSGDYISTYVDQRLEIEIVLRRLGYFDLRRSECFKALHRDGWTIKLNVDLSENIIELEKGEAGILDDFYSYTKDVKDALQDGLTSGIRFVLKDRSQESMARIRDQATYVDGVILSLQRELADGSGAQ